MSQLLPILVVSCFVSYDWGNRMESVIGEVCA